MDLGTYEWEMCKTWPELSKPGPLVSTGTDQDSEITHLEGIWVPFSLERRGEERR